MQTTAASTFLKVAGIGNQVRVSVGKTIQSMEFSRPEHWSGLPFPSPRDLPDPGMEPTSPALASGLFTTEPPGKPLKRLPHQCVGHSCSQPTKTSEELLSVTLSVLANNSAIRSPDQFDFQRHSAYF